MRGSAVPTPTHIITSPSHAVLCQRGASRTSTCLASRVHEGLVPALCAAVQSDAKAERAGAKAAKRVGRAKSGREEREEAAKKSAMEELRAARERKARGAEER